MKTSIYEDMKKGILTKEEYLTAKEKYAGKIAELETELDGKQAELNDFEQYMSGENRWLKAFSNIRDAKELTREMAVSLLDKVEVYEDKRIHIRFRFQNEYTQRASRVQGASRDTNKA